MSDNDEIRIDLSKITGLFRRKKKDSVKEEKEKIKELKEEEAELKQKEKELKKEEASLKAEEKEVRKEIKEEQKTLHDIEKEKKPEDETISIDFSKAKNFILKYHVVLILLAVIVLQLVPNDGFLPWGGIWMRMQSRDIPQAEDWGTNAVHNYYKTQIKEAVDKEYPNLPDANKEKIVNERFDEMLTENKDIIAQQIETTAKQLKSNFEYEYENTTYTYMPDIDPYFYLRFARNIIEQGHPYDEVKDNEPWDNRMVAPVGRPFDENSWIHNYILVYIYKIMKIFNSKLDLMQATSYFPLILVLLAIIPAFFIGRKFAGNVGGFFTASMVALSRAGFGRTTWGHADTDAYNIFFPLLIMWLFVEMFSAKELKKKLLYGSLTGLAVGFYSASWFGWWYVFDFILATIGIYLAYMIWVNRTNLQKASASIKQFIIVSVAFFISSAIFVTLFMNFSTFIQSPLQPIRFMTIKAAAQTSLWPNVFTTVAELNPSSIKAAIDSVGGSFLFFIAVLGLILMLMKKDEYGKYDIKYSALLTLWFIGTIYAATKGTRFTLLLTPAFAVAFGAGLGILYNKVTSWFEKEINLQRAISGTVLVLIFAVLLISPAKGDYATIKGDLPIINDAWWNTLIAINEKAAPDAIINSWWDFGHHFKYIADRAVTFDGASQATPQAHWIGKTLLTSNEEEAVGILRMLDCGGNTAFDILFEQTNNPHKSIDILYEIIVLDKAAAKEVLEKNKIKNADKVLEYTHCNPPENYFITSDDMISKAGVWAHFGSWNFERAEIWLNLRKLPKDKMIEEMQKKFSYDEEKAENVYYEVQAIGSEDEANLWISSWPGYATGLAGCSQEKNKLACGSGLSINLDDMTAKISVEGGDGIPQSLVYINENNSIVEKKFKDANIDASAVLVPKEDGYNSFLCNPVHAKGMFTRLFFMDGHGLEHFELFDEQTQVTGGKIYVWKVNWEGKEPRIHRALIEKEEVSKGDKVSASYIGWLDDGTVFDSSISGWRENNITKESSFSDYESKPLTFQASAGQMIKGFDEAVVGMKKGEIKTIKIAPEDAYGTNESAHPLGNKTLNFKVKIEKIK